MKSNQEDLDDLLRVMSGWQGHDVPLENMPPEMQLCMAVDALYTKDGNAVKTFRHVLYVAKLLALHYGLELETTMIDPNEIH